MDTYLCVIVQAGVHKLASNGTRIRGDWFNLLSTSAHGSKQMVYIQRLKVYKYWLCVIGS